MPSRRSFLTAATATTALLAGCTGLDASGSEPSPTDAESAFEVRLDGPETTRNLFDDTDVATVGEVREAPTGAYALAVTLTDGATQAVSETFGEAGVDNDPDAFEVVLRFEGETTGRFEVSPGLADEVAYGGWDGELRLTIEDERQATAVRRALTDEG